MNKFKELFFLYKNTFVWGFILIVIAILTFALVYYFGIIESENEQIVESQLTDIQISEHDNTKESIKNDMKEEQLTSTNLIKVDIKGKVKKPGVYEVDSNLRVIDAIKKAGGVTNDADTSVINLSKKLYDEMVIIIYSKTEVKNISQIKVEEQKKQKVCLSNEKLVNGACITIEEKKEENISNKKVSINTDNIEDLMALDGIGESKAKEIIAYRKANGNFKKIEDILNVEGIGESIFEKIKDDITT